LQVGEALTPPFSFCAQVGFFGPLCSDALWLCTKLVDMRCGAELLLAHVVHALGELPRSILTHRIFYDQLGML